MAAPASTATLLVSCPDQRGIVAALAQLLYGHGANILDADQHTDTRAGVFFQRIRFDLGELRTDRTALEQAIREVALRLRMEWRLSYAGIPKRMAIFASKTDHCLYDLLLRHRAGELACEIPLVVSNHADLEPVARHFGIAYRVFELTPETKSAQEQAELALLDAQRIDLVVLARYMQVLSPQFVERYRGRIINIHHSFLPAFSGGRPYHQAHERGVKLIGATAHYATKDLDEGPIIEQDVIRASHRDTVDELVRKGRDVERAVLSRAVRWHLDDRVWVYGNKTVVFLVNPPAGTNIRLIGFALAFLVVVGSWALTCAAWRFDKVAAGVVPLDPREFERMTLVTLGTAGAWEDPNRRGPAIAVAVGRDVALVDAGRGVAEALRAAKLPMTQPRLLLLTSLLPENALGLDDLLAARWLQGGAPALRVLGPPGTAALVREIDAALRPGARARSEALGSGEPPAPEVQEVGDGFRETLGELAFSAGALAGGPVPALAWRFEWRGRTAVVSSAGWAPDALVAFAKGANLWVHEAVMLPTPEQAKELGADADPERLRREAALHTGIASVGALAQRIGSQSLVLVRLRPPPVFDLQITSLIGDAYAGRVLIAEDGDELTP